MPKAYLYVLLLLGSAFYNTDPKEQLIVEGLSGNGEPLVATTDYRVDL